MNNYIVPLGYWQKACEEMDYPLACVCPDNKFLWVNQAFERMLGYSSAELAGRTWMSITEQSFVGGDLASVEAVISGRISNYTMSKNYIHKRGHMVSVELTVHRFPESSVENLVCFIVEAPPTRATKPELDEVEKNLMKIIHVLEERINENEKGISISMGNRNDSVSNSGSGDNVGRDKNSDSAIKILGGVMCVMVVMGIWMFYYITVASKAEMPNAPPQIEVIK